MIKYPFTKQKPIPDLALYPAAEPTKIPYGNCAKAVGASKALRSQDKSFVYLKRTDIAVMGSEGCSDQK
jgi:hypothetical protein